MLLAQIKKMYTLCFRFGKLRDIACCRIFNLIQILLQLALNRPHAFRAISDAEVILAFLCYCHFPIWCPGSGVLLDCIDS